MRRLGPRSTKAARCRPRRRPHHSTSRRRRRRPSHRTTRGRRNASRPSYGRCPPRCPRTRAPWTAPPTRLSPSAPPPPSPSTAPLARREMRGTYFPSSTPHLPPAPPTTTMPTSATAAGRRRAPRASTSTTRTWTTPPGPSCAVPSARRAHSPQAEALAARKCAVSGALREAPARWALITVSWGPPLPPAVAASAAFHRRQRPRLRRW